MTDFEVARHNMVESQVHTADVTDPRILDAMSEIPREQFLPAHMRAVAYMDEDVRLREAGEAGPARYLMEPMTFARLVQLAEIEHSDLVLDVGCATGYSSAVLARLAGSVVALECDEEMAASAAERLLDLGIDNVAVVTGPLADGYPGQGPYDVIVLGGSVPDVPEALTAQLKEGGRLVAVLDRGPVGKARLFVRAGGMVSSRVAFDASVMPLPGFQEEPKFLF